MSTQYEAERKNISSVLLNNNDHDLFGCMSNGNNDAQEVAKENHEQQMHSVDNDWSQNGGNDNTLDSHRKPRGQSVGPLTRCSSAPWRCGRSATAHTHGSLVLTDAASNMRLRSIISSARFSAMRGSCGASQRRYSTALTEGERAAIAQMLLNEERRQAAHQRVIEEEERRGQMLIEHEIEKETATLNRIVELERKKVQRLQEGKVKQLSRMLQAKQRREAMERERQQKLDAIQRTRNQRIVRRDPYAMRTAIQKYKTLNSEVSPR